MTGTTKKKKKGENKWNQFTSHFGVSKPSELLLGQIARFGLQESIK
jgi:hypothetical protein